jgi:hypothetical protein
MNFRIRKRKPSGLTFIEILVGLTLFAVILMTATTILHSFIKAHYTVESAPLFRHHVQGVHEFIHLLAQSQPIDRNTNPGHRFNWGRVPESEQYNISFSVDSELPFFVSDLKPLPPLTAFLRYDLERNNLWLLWFVDPRLTENSRQLRYSLLSTWVADIEFAYLDEANQSWVVESIRDESRQRGNQRPEKVYFTFQHQGQILRRSIAMENVNFL